MDVVLEVIIIGVTTGTVVFVLGLFVWGALKDGQDNDARPHAARRRGLRRIG
ncbi:MAG TPA: hypothetical protein VGM80_01795 [Gaiellaceae bacterium]